MSKGKLLLQKFFGNRKKVIVAILIFDLTLIPLILLFNNLRAKKTEAAWWDDGWAYRKSISVANSSGSVLTDFQVSLTLDTSDTTKFQSNCGDIRITDVNGKILSLWVEENNPGCGSASTVIWTKVPYVPTTGTTLYVYYGNNSASQSSSGSSVFESFDDFNSNTIANYTVTAGSAAISSGNLNITGVSNGNAVIAPTAQSPLSSYIVEARASYTDKGGATDSLIGVLGYQTTVASTTTGYVAEYGIASSASKVSIEKFTVSHLATTTITYSAGTAYEIKGVFKSGNLKATFDRTTDASSTDTSYTSGYFGLRTYDADGVVDWWFVRKQASSDPTTSLGSEEKGPGPIAYWKFDEGYGNVSTDSGSLKIQGTLSNATWLTEDMCVSGKCLDFNGTDSNVNVGTSNAINITGDVTYEAWIKLTASTFPDGTTNWTIFNNESYQNYGTILRVDGASKVIYLRTNQAGASTGSQSTSTINNNTWYHVAVVKSGSNVTFYLNGNGEPGSSTVSNPVTSSTSMKIGNTSQSFNGIIDEPKIYNYARTRDQIRLDYNSGLAGAGVNEGTGVSFGVKANKWMSENLVGYWKLNEASGNPADSSGNSNTLTNTNTAVFAAGKFGNGADIESGDDPDKFFTIADNTVLSLTGNITISSWIKPESVTASTLFTIAAKWQVTDNESFYLAQYGDEIRFYVDSSSNYVTSNSVNMSAATWYFVSAVYSASTQTVTLYVNGQSVASTVTGTIPLSIGDDSGSFCIGAIPDAGAEGTPLYPYDGIIDEVRLYSRALNGSEVANLYNWAPGPVDYFNFEEGNGSLIYDKAGNDGSTGLTWTGTLGRQWTSGKYGMGANFNGTDNCASGNGKITISNYYTVNAWVKPNVTQTSVYFSTRGGYSFDMQLSTTGLHGDIGDGATSWYTTAADATVSISNGSWTYVTYVVTPTSWTIYVNGVNTNSGTYASGTPSLYSASKTLRIGCHGGTSDWFNGTLDEVKIYNYERTIKQIIQDMNAGHPAPGSPVGSAIGYWKFDEGYGTVASNSGSLGFTANGTLTGPSWNNQGKFNKSLNFNASSEVIVTENNAFDPAEITLSAWIKPDQVAINWAGQIINKGGNSGYRLRIYASTASSYILQFYDRGTTNALGSLGTLNYGQWNHIVVTGNSSGLKIYINGSLNNSNTTAYGGPNTAQNLSIGNDIDYGEYFVGSIDEVKFYNFALTASEVKLDYNHSSSTVLGSFSDTSGLSGGSIASNSASAIYCVPGSTDSCNPPIGEWKFEEGAGSLTYDKSGQTNNFTWYGTLGNQWTSGKYGKGGYLDGSTNYLQSPFSSSLNPTSSNWTVSSWVKTTKKDTIVYCTTNSANACTGVNDHLGLKVDSNGKAVYTFSAGDVEVLATSTTSIDDNKWHFVLGTRTGIRTGNIYVDGVLENTHTPTGSSTSVDIDQAIKIGQINSANYFQGVIDQVLIYNYARTTSQIAWDYNQGKPYSWWKFNECAGMTAYDSMPASNSGAIIIGSGGTQASLGTCTNNAATAWYNGRTGKYNSSLSFDGTDDYVEIDNTAPTFYDNLSEGSISAWIYVQDSADLKTIFSISQGNSLNNNALQFFISASEKFSWLISDGGSQVMSAYSNDAISTNIWHHVVLTIGANGSNAYVDGQKITITYGAGSQTLTTFFHDLSSLSHVRIGMFRNNNANTSPFYGQIDEVKIYSYPLTRQQVLNDYNQGSAVRFGPSSGTP